MIANPHPVATQLNGGKFRVANVTGATSPQLADRIWIWNPVRSSYDQFYYYDDGSEAGWTDDEHIEDIEGWQGGIPVGHGLYFKAKGADKSVVFDSPLAE